MHDLIVCGGERGGVVKSYGLLPGKGAKRPLTIIKM